MRTIETEDGTLTGKVDRVEQRVVWSLGCPDCGNAIELTRATFTGQEPPHCGCGWRATALAAEGDRRWFDFEAGFETVPAAQQAGVA